MKNYKKWFLGLFLLGISFGSAASTTDYFQVVANNPAPCVSHPISAKDMQNNIASQIKQKLTDLGTDGSNIKLANPIHYYTLLCGDNDKDNIREIIATIWYEKT